MTISPTQKAITAFFHGAALPKDWCPEALRDIPIPSWLMDVAMGEQKNGPHKLRSIFDLLTDGQTTAPVNDASEPTAHQIPYSTYNEIYLENLLLWGKENLDFLPSADVYVNRYEAGRLAAALTAIDSGKSSPSITLIAGDLSGVQDFIYTITNKGAVSALRGRSLYLQLLTEAIARYALNYLELPIANLLYMGGGQFHILAGETHGKKIDTLRKTISNILLTHHRGSLSLTLADVTLESDELSGEKLTAKRKALNENLQERKKRRFAELDSDLSALFAPQGHGGNEEQQCSVCGQEDRGTMPVLDDDGNDTDSRICPACVSYEELGKDLRKANYLILRPAALQHDDKGYKKILHAFGLDASFAEDLHKDTGDKEIVLAINRDTPVDLSPSQSRAVGRRFLVNLTPLMSEEDSKNYEPEEGERKPKKGDIKPFKMLAEQANGINRLGVLRMDIDDLGNIFASKIGDKATLGRLNALSAKISEFFEGEVEKIAQGMQGDRLYSIYSGGDDLFFVGAWDAVIELAVAIRKELDIFSGTNPHIHASAGVVLISNKYPLAQAAQAAGMAEHQAKSLLWWHGDQKRTKDAITFLGQSLPWQKFSLSEGSTYDLMRQLNGMLQENTAGAPIYNLLRYYAQYQEALKKRQQEKGETQTKEGKPQPIWGRWMWLGYYYLKKKNVPPDLQALADELKNTEFNAMETLGVAARWAMLLNRGR